MMQRSRNCSIRASSSPQAPEASRTWDRRSSGVAEGLGLGDAHDVDAGPRREECLDGVGFEWPRKEVPLPAVAAGALQLVVLGRLLYPFGQGFEPKALAQMHQAADECAR